jgi:hypothetical protein
LALAKGVDFAFNLMGSKSAHKYENGLLKMRGGWLKLTRRQAFDKETAAAVIC